MNPKSCCFCLLLCIWAQNCLLSYGFASSKKLLKVTAENITDTDYQKFYRHVVYTYFYDKYPADGDDPQMTACTAFAVKFKQEIFLLSAAHCFSTFFERNASVIERKLCIVAGRAQYACCFLNRYPRISSNRSHHQ